MPQVVERQRDHGHEPDVDAQCECGIGDVRAHQSGQQHSLVMAPMKKPPTRTAIRSAPATTARLFRDTRIGFRVGFQRSNLPEYRTDISDDTLQDVRPGIVLSL